MSQLSLPIQEFYLALPDGDRQYAQEQAQEIRLIQHNAAVKIGSRLIDVKERLGHGKFGDWIKLEFEWSDRQARTLMTIASEFGERKDTSDLPTATMPLYALASAMAKTDEEGKQEILDSYQEALTEKQNQAIEQAELERKEPKIPTSLTEKEIKEILAERDRLKSAVENLQSEKTKLSTTVAEQTTLINQANQKAQEQAELVTKANVLMQSEAERIAELKTQKLAEEYQAKLTAELTKARESADESLKKAEDAYKSALEKFKANPDPQTKKALDELKGERSKLSDEVYSLKRRLENVRSVGENRAAMIATVNNFLGLFEQAVKAHPNILIAAASPLVDDAHADRLEDMADFLEEFAGKLRKALTDRQFNEATEIRSVDVEVVDDEEDF